MNYDDLMAQRGCTPKEGWILYVPMSHAGRALPPHVRPHPLVREGGAIVLRGELPTSSPREPAR